MNEEIIKVKKLEVFFDTYAGKVHAVRNISFNLIKGETLAIVGESGCGKTVTVKSIMRILPKMQTSFGKSSEVFFNGENLFALTQKEMSKIRGENISMIFQDPMASLNPTMRIGDQISEAIELHSKKSKSEIKNEVIRLLDLVKIPNARKRVKQYPHEFSGGMKQRVMIAIALACNPEVLIADEPTTALDVTIQAQIMELLKEIQKELNTAIILVTHDLGVVAGNSDRIHVMYGGKIVEKGSVDEIFYKTKHPYTKALLKSVPSVMTKNKSELYCLLGTPPDLLDPPKGCPFYPRCEYSMKICQMAVPEDITYSSTHQVSCWLEYKKLVENTDLLAKEVCYGE